MFRPLVQWIAVLVIFAGAGSVSAHSGFENETDVRIYADRMEVNIRATLGFAWKILGDRAPADAGEAGQKAAEPMLREKAVELFEVTAGGKPMLARSASCLFELDQHVFWRLVFERPSEWPLVVKAEYFDFFDPMTYGTVKVFDQTDDPYRRDIEAVAADKIYRSKPAFTYDPAPPAAVVVADELTVVPDEMPVKPESRDIRRYLLAALLLVLLWGIKRVVVRKPAS